MQKLLIATTNPGKLAEYKKFLSDLPLTLVSLQDEHIAKIAPEQGNTFAANARTKALFYHTLSGLATIADDGGFEIDYLKGEPGVHSHRWINFDREDTDEEIVNYAIGKMRGVPIGQRGAQLHLILAFAAKGQIVETSESAVRGIVAEEAAIKRERGFPYRALLYFPERKKYYGELTLEEMEEYNHRKKAVEKLKPVIKKYLL